MKVSTALLCDFAQVRDGLLFVQSGGISRMWRDDIPASLGCHLALVIDLDSVEQQRPHELRIRIIDEDGGPVAEVQGGFQASGGDLAEIIHVPVTLDLTPVAIEKHGTYDVKIYVDGHHQGDLTVRALPRPQAQ